MILEWGTLSYAFLLDVQEGSVKLTVDTSYQPAELRLEAVLYKKPTGRSTSTRLNLPRKAKQPKSEHSTKKIRHVYLLRQKVFVTRNRCVVRNSCVTGPSNTRNFTQDSGVFWGVRNGCVK